MKTVSKDGLNLRVFTVGKSRFLAYPECGARLMSWHHTNNKEETCELITWPASAPLDRKTIGKVRGGNPVLFPFSARTFCEKELGFWKASDGVRRPMQVHGYARNGDFELVSISEEGFSARFLPGSDCQAAYPYAYRFTVHYRFFESGLEVEFELENQDEVPIPWSAGHHFYFAMPAVKRRDFRYQIDAASAFKHGTDGALIEQNAPSTVGRFDEADLSDRIHTGLKDATVCFGPFCDGQDLNIRIEQPNPPHPWTAVVTWTESETSPFYCVEPWMGPPNSPEHGKGLHLVAPREIDRFRVSISLK
ncbi:MAG: aldose epimerase [Puniceicoccaceae bacterium]|nr:MAG: aldose epimerase [Puniceicoccaceae bacterium]